MLATNVGLDLDVDLSIIESTDLVIESMEENLREQGTLQSASACRLPWPRAYWNYHQRRYRSFSDGELKHTQFCSSLHRSTYCWHSSWSWSASSCRSPIMERWQSYRREIQKLFQEPTRRHQQRDNQSRERRGQSWGRWRNSSWNQRTWRFDEENELSQFWRCCWS